MKALTLLKPWSWCITHLDKRIENRTWKPPQSIIGTRIAIHAGKGLDDFCRVWLRARGLFADDLPDEAYDGGVIVATAVVEGYVYNSKDKWFTGPVGWVLRDVDVLPCGVPCRGMQGLWPVPTDIERWITPERQCIGYGIYIGKCANQAGSPWSPYWCPRCNALRLDTIDSSLKDIASQNVSL